MGLFFLYLLVWVVVGLGLGVLAGLAARAVCRHRGMYQLGERAFWVCLACGLLNAHILAAIAFCIVAYVRDRDVGGGVPAPTVPAPAPAAPGGLLLVCAAGPLNGQVYGLTQGAVLTVGTDPANTVRVPAGTPGVSRRHCCVRWQNGGACLVDLGSTYGTFLAGGRKLPPQYPTELRPGDAFYLGSTGCLFRIAAG